MLLSQILLSLSTSLFVSGYSLQIAVQDSQTKNDRAIPGIQGSANSGDPLMHTFVAPSSLSPFGCSGSCPGAGVCPGNNNTVRISSSGTPFKLKCGQNVSLDPNFSSDQQPSLVKCIDSCALKASCLAAVYQGTTCYYAKKYTPYSTPNLAWDSAIKMSTDGAVNVNCDVAKLQFIHTATRTYTVHCGYDPDVPVFRETRGWSYEDCADQCDAMRGCAMVVMREATNSCLMRSTWAPSANGDRQAAGHTLLVPESGIKPHCSGE